MLRRINQYLGIVTAALLAAGSASAAMTTNLQAYIPLDETSGTDVYSVGLGTGINVGADIGAEGIIGTAYDFETDEEDWVNFNDPATVGATMTFAAFVKPESLRTDLTGANSRNGVLFSDSSYYGFGTTQGRLHMLLHDGTTYQDHISGAAGALTLGVYQHIAATTSIVPDGNGMYTSTVKFYIDGIHVDTVVRTVNSDSRGSKDMTVANAGTQRKWDGLIDEAAIWSSTLSDQEIALVNGLARLAQVTANDAALDDVMAAFNAGLGNSAMAGGYEWVYTAGLGAGPVGTIGGSVGGSDAFIILDASGNGVQVSIPEPASLGLLALGAVLIVRRR